jgi:hypothetical protein
MANCFLGWISVCLFVLLSHSFFRHLSHEVVFFLHLTLTGLFVYSICQHLKLMPLVWKPPVPKLYASIFTTVFVLTFTIHIVKLIYQNWRMGVGFSEAYVFMPMTLLTSG